MRAALLLSVPLLLTACEAQLETGCYDGPCGVTTTTSANDGGGGAGGSGGGIPDCPDTVQTGQFPCDVYTVLENNCHVCHMEPHMNGAPIDLFTYARTQETDCNGTQIRWKTMRYYVIDQNPPFMPLGGMLNEADTKTMKDWFDACAPPAPDGMGCEGTPGVKACYEP